MKPMSDKQLQEVSSNSPKTISPEVAVNLYNHLVQSGQIKEPSMTQEEAKAYFGVKYRDMGFLKGLLVVFGVACLWTVGVLLLLYIISLLPAVIIGGVAAVAVLVMYLRLTDIYG